jgi:HSP20 family protein
MVVWSRTMRGWDPWLEMRRLEREWNAPQWPQVTAKTSETGVQLRALVPGFAIEDLELTVRGDELTLRGKRKSEAAHEQSEFERSWKLPFPIEAEKVKAIAKDGVLDVELPRAAADSPRRIQVQAG